jgi:predicted alpha/beta-hydrolase family hydrolase
VPHGAQSSTAQSSPTPSARSAIQRTRSSSLIKRVYRPRMCRTLLFLLFAAVGLRGEDTTTVKIATPRGVKLVADHHVPAEPNGTAVVLAPGQGYHRGLPLLTESAEALAAAGVHVLRFDWAYFTAKGERSRDFATEREDLEAVLAHAKAIDGVDKVILAGKSLGSMVAFFRAVEKRDDLAGLALLTFPLHASGQPTHVFREMQALRELDLPVLLLGGDKDSLAAVGATYALAAACRTPPQVVIVPGDHGLNDPVKTDAKTRENCRLAAHALTVWAKRRIGR